MNRILPVRCRGLTPTARETIRLIHHRTNVPYQGSLGCLEIEFGRGVCGTAAAEKRTVVVDDVELFPGHITCDVKARSEIVVPVFNRRNDLIAVLDVDSEERGSFSDEDRTGLEGIVKWFKRTL